MVELVDSLRGEARSGPPRVRLETAPVKVEATRAYREGKMEQMDFFAALGLPVS